VANVLSLAMKINADASGFKLDPVQRALVGLGDAADKVTAQFDKFASGSDAATRVQAQFADQLQTLQNALRDGEIGATQFTVEFEKLTAAAEAEAKAFEQAAKITEASRSPLQKYQQVVGELSAQLKAGRISQETYTAAMAKAKESLDKAADSAGKTDKNVASLNANLKLLTNIEIGRVIVDGFQAISGVLQSAVGQVTSLASSVTQSLDTLSDLSARTGINVEDFQGFSLAAKLAGVDAAAFGTAVQRLGVQISQATPGEAFDRSLQSIGLSVAQLRALSPEQQFAAIGDAISQLPTAADRAAAAVEVFGKQGAALAPLFREGAAGIDELRERAERLGVIVSEEQVANISAMNDAFDLVSATLQGIIGQVIGNLAPAVTEVTEQFLRFVEEWSGAEGEGGTGIANAISDVLLKGADVLAGVFDYAVEQFGGFSDRLGDVSAAFSAIGSALGSVGNTITVAVESLRVIFNVFESIGNGIAIALGAVLEGIGSWVSSDMEAFGRDLQQSARESLERNTKDMESAATNAANAVVEVFAGAPQSAADAGRGSAREFVQTLSADIKNARLPEVKLESNTEELRDRFDALFNGLIDHTSDAAKAMAEFERSMAAAHKDGELTADEIARLEGLQKAVNAAIDEENRKRREAAVAANLQIEADQKRVEALLKTSEDANKLQDDLAAVYREIARTQEQLAAARGANSRGEADAAAARLAELDQIQAKLEDLQQANEQGFEQGFDKAFRDTAKTLDALIDKVSKFGNEGAKAAYQLQEGIANAQERVRAGILSQDAYQAEVAAAQATFNQRLAHLEEIDRREREQQARAFQARVEANDRLNQFMQSQMTEQQRAEAAAIQQNADRRQQAAENIRAIEERIAVQRKSIEAAREQNDLRAAKARQEELRQLEKLQRTEQKIADGKVKANTQINRAANTAQQAQLAQQQVIANAARNQAQATQTAATNAVDQVNQAFAAAADRQRKLLKDLNTLGSRTVSAADARTQEGAALVLGLFANAQDPRLIEQRLATKILRQIATGITQNLSRIGIPATLL